MRNLLDDEEATSAMRVMFLGQTPDSSPPAPGSCTGNAGNKMGKQSEDLESAVANMVAVRLR